MIKDDSLLLAQMEDRIKQADEQYRIVSGDFMDMHQRKIAGEFCKTRRLPVRIMFYGGYDDAERCIPVFLPDYVEIPENGVPQEVMELLQVVRVTVPKGGRELTHRDYLGSLLALGLDREVAGDILVRKPSGKSGGGAYGGALHGGGADIIVLAEIADFIELNYSKAGRTSLSVEVLPVSQLDRGTFTIEERGDTVASLRLDCMVASAFNISRAKAAEAIRRGIVSVNSLEATKVDMEVDEGDKIVMRGRGRVILARVGGTTRKDRIRVTFNVYV